MTKRIALVVDDSKSARYALAKMLEAQQYAVNQAESPDAAYAWLEGGRPDVIFLDHIMPGVDGFDVLRRLKSEARTVTFPVVICSSHEGEDFVQQARSRGAADVLTKPPTPDQLKAVLQRVAHVATALRPAPAPAAEAPAPPPAPPAAPKVQPIRTPEAAIEQRVMQTLRDALAPVEAPAPAAAAAVPPAEPAGADRMQSQREHFDNKLRRLTQDFYAQLAEVKAHLAGLDDAFTDPDRLREMIREEIRSALTQVREDALQAARAEARAEIERTMMDAAARISEQMAQSLLKSLAAGTLPGVTSAKR